jgi:uncharacterized membrane protein YgdD (TMEM256/DUF423 family)
MFLGVALGAFAAHGLKAKLPAELFNVFEVGVRYQIYHALGLFVVGWLAEAHMNDFVTWAGWFFVAGIFLFSGSLYLYSLSGARWLVFLTPLGGLLFLAGWACLFISASR